MNKTESVAEFLLRGGKINRLDNGSQQTVTNSVFISSDKKLKALKALRPFVENDAEKSYLVENAIEDRYNSLKGM